MNFTCDPLFYKLISVGFYRNLLTVRELTDNGPSSSKVYNLSPTILQTRLQQRAFTRDLRLSNKIYCWAYSH